MDQSLVDKPWKLLLLRMDLPGDTGDVTSCAPHKMNVQRITLQDLGEHFLSSFLWLPHVWVVVLMMLLARLFQDEHKMHCEVMVLIMMLFAEMEFPNVNSEHCRVAPLSSSQQFPKTDTKVTTTDLCVGQMDWQNQICCAQGTWFHSSRMPQPFLI